MKTNAKFQLKMLYTLIITWVVAIGITIALTIVLCKYISDMSTDLIIDLILIALYIVPVIKRTVSTIKFYKKSYVYYTDEEICVYIVGFEEIELKQKLSEITVCVEGKAMIVEIINKKEKYIIEQIKNVKEFVNGIQAEQGKMTIIEND